MKRADLFAVLVGLVVVTGIAAEASAVYCPATGQFLRRDPGPGGIMAASNVAGGFFLQDAYADGMNLYQRALGGPVAVVDPSGLWHAAEHTSITQEAFEQAFPQKLSGKTLECKQHVIDSLVKANLSQDQGPAFNENKRHYNRDLKQAVAQGNAAYTAYLAEELAKFKALLAKVESPCLTKEGQQSCEEALSALGRLSHSWEDYFAHAVLVGGNAGPAWAASPQIKGSPDDLNPQLIPSTWGSVIRSGEHGWSEPADRDNPGGRQKRYDDARDFVAAKFGKYAVDWYFKCRCCCPPKF